MKLEKRTGVPVYTVHVSLDDKIPFNELFVIPYVAWFAFIAWILIYTCLTSREQFIKAFVAMFGGMTVCLIIYTVWPSVQDLRPLVMPRDNILTRLVSYIYSVDSPTNVCPSIHVYNSIIAFIAVSKVERFKHPVRIKSFSLVLAILICLSTMFLKQHSAFDVVCGVLLSLIAYLIVYVPDYSTLFAKSKEAERREA